MPTKGGTKKNPFLLKRKWPAVSAPFALLTACLIMLIGFVAVLAQLFKTEDYLYWQFGRTGDQIETLRIKTDELKEQNRDLKQKLDNFNVRIEYYVPTPPQQ
jgi:hypothetical protein